MFQKLKWAWQRAVRGYDDTLMWGLDESSHQFVAPIEAFCREELAEEEHMELNPERAHVFRKTVEFIETYKNAGENWATWQERKQFHEATSRMWEYIGRNIGYYWD